MVIAGRVANTFYNVKLLNANGSCILQNYNLFKYFKHIAQPQCWLQCRLCNCAVQTVSAVQSKMIIISNWLWSRIVKFLYKNNSKRINELNTRMAGLLINKFELPICHLFTVNIICI